MEISENNTVVYYDGECGFCHSSVQFILKRRKQDIYFMPLQTEGLEAVIEDLGGTLDLETIYLSHNGRFYTRSSAALNICRLLKGGYPLLYGFIIVPRFIRDGVYNAIAKRRHRIRKGFCVVPTEEEKKFFIG